MKCCNCSFFRRKIRSKSPPYGSHTIITNESIDDDPHESVDDTPMRILERSRGTMRSQIHSIMRNDSFNLHLTRMSDIEKEAMSWQIKTAIEINSTLNPLMLTAIENEESINNDKEGNEMIEKKSEGTEDEKNDTLLITAIEKSFDDREDEERSREEMNGDKKKEDEIKEWTNDVEGEMNTMDNTDGFGTGINELPYKKGDIKKEDESVSPSSNLSRSLSLHSIQLTPQIRNDMRSFKFICI